MSKAGAFKTLSVLAILAVAGLLAVPLGYVALRLGQSKVESQIYKQRLIELGEDYEDLRHRHNSAVRQTAVTELLVTEEQVDVVIRTAEGELSRVPTPYRAGDVVNVDYLVLDGRLQVRRVYNEQTPPRDGVLIDPDQAYFDWDTAADAFGTVIYKRLSPGRWIVSVSGNGALGLAEVDEQTAVTLVPAPHVKQYEPIEEALRRRLDEFGVVDVVRQWFRPKADPSP